MLEGPTANTIGWIGNTQRCKNGPVNFYICTNSLMWIDGCTATGDKQQRCLCFYLQERRHCNYSRVGGSSGFSLAAFQRLSSNLAVWATPCQILRRSANIWEFLARNNTKAKILQTYSTRREASQNQYS